MNQIIILYLLSASLASESINNRDSKCYVNELNGKVIQMNRNDSSFIYYTYLNFHGMTNFAQYSGSWVLDDDGENIHFKVYTMYSVVTGEEVTSRVDFERFDIKGKFKGRKLETDTQNSTFKECSCNSKLLIEIKQKIKASRSKSLKRN